MGVVRIERESAVASKEVGRAQAGEGLASLGNGREIVGHTENDDGNIPLVKVLPESLSVAQQLYLSLGYGDDPAADPQVVLGAALTCELEKKGVSVAGSRWMKSNRPWPPGFMPVIRLAHATGLCGGMLVCRGRKLPCAARAAKCGISPAAMNCRRSSGSMPSMPRIMSLWCGAGDSVPRMTERDIPSATARSVTAATANIHLRNRFIFVRRSGCGRSSRAHRCAAQSLLET